MTRLILVLAALAALSLAVILFVLREMSDRDPLGLRDDEWELWDQASGKRLGTAVDPWVLERRRYWLLVLGRSKPGDLVIGRAR